MTDAQLPDRDHLSRHCKPSSIDAFGLPMASAFELRKGEPYLSTNWLEYFDTLGITTSVSEVRQAFIDKGYRLRPNGRFAVFNIGAARIAARDVAGHTLRIEHQPLDDDESHAGVFGSTEDDFAVAVELKALVAHQDVYPALG